MEFLAMEIKYNHFVANWYRPIRRVRVTTVSIERSQRTMSSTVFDMSQLIRQRRVLRCLF